MISRSGLAIGQNLDAFPGLVHRASPAVQDARILSLFTWFSLLGYLFSLAVTQTVYFAPFMSLRWAMLGLLAASSTADLILISRHPDFKMQLGNGKLLILYLFLTFGSVIYAENWMFSGMRWISHAMMLVVFMIVLPHLITLKQIQLLLRILKYMIAVLVILSWVLSAPPSLLSKDSLYQGAMGNANAMGHVSVIASILFLQTFILSRTPRNRLSSGFFTLAAMITLWNSGARSSMIALAVGILMLLYFYRKEMKGPVLIGALLFSIGMVSLPTLPQRLFRFAQKSTVHGETKSLDPMKSRIPVWSAAYEGFKRRPLLGWGFGADSNIKKDWQVQLTAVGTVDRDAVNDFMFMMEGCGVVGLFSYVLLIVLVWKQSPSRFHAYRLQAWSREQRADSRLVPHHAHAVLFILPVCLLVLNQFDNTALSAGNLISMTLWLCAGCASALRRKIGRSEV